MHIVLLVGCRFARGGSQGLPGARQTLPLPLSYTLGSAWRQEVSGGEEYKSPGLQHQSEQTAVIDLPNTGSLLAVEAPEVRIQQF